MSKVGPKSQWETFNEWYNFGIKKNYNEKSPSSLYNKKKTTECRWYRRGVHKKIKGESWLSQFNLNKVKIQRWKKFTVWRNHGIKNNYKYKTAKTIENSENIEERSWYQLGHKKKWLKSFNFKNGRVKNWPEFEDWKNYGIQKGYHKRNREDIAKSEIEAEKIWHWKGKNHNWLTQFNFTRKHKEKGYFKDFKNLEEELEVVILSNDGLFPSKTELRRMKRDDLIHAFRYHNGIPAVRERMGYHKSKRIELAKQLEQILGGLSI